MGARSDNILGVARVRNLSRVIDTAFSQIIQAVTFVCLKHELLGSLFDLEGASVRLLN